MTSKRSTIANQNMHGFNKVKSNKKRNSTLLLDDDSGVIGSVGNDMSNKSNAVLASQAAMAALYNKANPSTTTSTTAKKIKTKKVVTSKVTNHKTTNPKHAPKMKNSNTKKLPITKIVIPEDISANKNKLKREKVEAMYKKHSLPTAKTTYKQKHVSKNIPKNSMKTDGHHYTEFVKLQKEATALDNNVKKNSTSKSNKLHDKPLVQKKRNPQNISGALGSSTSLSSKNNVDPKNKIAPKLGLSAMAASKALSEFKNMELALEHDADDSGSVDTFDKNLNKQSFNIVKNPRKLTVEEEIQEQVYNEEMLKNLERDTEEALKINAITNKIAANVLKNHSHGDVDNKTIKIQDSIKNNNNNNINNDEYEEDADEESITSSEKQKVEPERDEEIISKIHSEPEVSFNLATVKRRPPPLTTSENISFANLPKLETNFSSIKEEPLSGDNTVEAITNLSNDTDDIHSLQPTPLAYKHSFRSISDPVNINNSMEDIEKKRSRAITISDKSPQATTSSNKSPTTRFKRSHTISTLFKDMLSSGNTSPTNTSAAVTRASSFTTKESTVKTNNDPACTHSSPNILRRTIRSLSLSLNNSGTATDKSKTTPSTPKKPEEKITKKNVAENEKLNHGNERPEYSVLQNTLLPSYYKTRNSLNLASNGSDNGVQFRTTLREDAQTSKGSKLKNYIHWGHSNNLENDNSNSKEKHSFFGHSKNKRSIFTDSKDTKNKKEGGLEANRRYSNSTMRSSLDYTSNNSNSMGHRNSYSSSGDNFTIDDTKDSDDMLSYFENSRDIKEEKPHSNGHKTDLFLKLPAKLAYKSMKKHADNWEFSKNKTFNKVLHHDDKRPSLSEETSFINSEYNTSIPTTDHAIQQLQQQQQQPESNYILGLHSRSKKSKKFDENKPWKSHVDLGYITSEEKKRYEGIWVSNKNRFLEMLPQQNHHLKKIHSNRLTPEKSPHSLLSGDTDTVVRNLEKMEPELVVLQNSVSPQSTTMLLPLSDPSNEVGVPTPQISVFGLPANGTGEQDKGEYGADDDYDGEEEEEDLMVNFVVYEIYNRSNLPPRILRQIYYMVDLRHDGTITKKSFIVGMWLIDQCLYGKKLPAVIPDLVWDSVEKMVIGVDVSHKSIQKNKKRNARREIKELKRHEKIVKESNKKELQQQQLQQQSLDQ